MVSYQRFIFTSIGEKRVYVGGQNLRDEKVDKASV
jgi:hypothetical protein